MGSVLSNCFRNVRKCFTHHIAKHHSPTPKEEHAITISKGPGVPGSRSEVKEEWASKITDDVEVMVTKDSEGAKL